MKITVENINVNKLCDELISKGIVPLLIESVENTTCITFEDDTDMDLVQQIIDAHDPTPLPPQPTQEELLKQELAKTNAMVLELTEFILGGM